MTGINKTTTPIRSECGDGVERPMLVWTHCWCPRDVGRGALVVRAANLFFSSVLTALKTKKTYTDDTHRRRRLTLVHPPQRATPDMQSESIADTFSFLLCGSNQLSAKPPRCPPTNPTDIFSIVVSDLVPLPRHVCLHINLQTRRALSPSLTVERGPFSTTHGAPSIGHRGGSWTPSCIWQRS